jgi:hypothetical protein
MNDNARKRFRDMPLDEFRRRVDLALTYLRDMRRGIAAATGMVLEHEDRALPVLDNGHAELALKQLTEMLPLVRLSPEERAQMKPMDRHQRDAMEGALEEMAEMDPDEFNEYMKEAGLEYTHEDLVSLQEEGEKIRLLGLVQEETEALVPALAELQSALGERARNLLTGALQTAALRKAAGGRGAAS